MSSCHGRSPQPAEQIRLDCLTFYLLSNGLEGVRVRQNLNYGYLERLGRPA